MLIAFVIIVIHFIADFVLQDGKWAVGKSKNWPDLLYHTATYSITWLIPIYFLFNQNQTLNTIINTVLFVLITFICHTLTDYFTSRHSSKQYEMGNFGTSIPRGLDFFVTIGFDQVLHYAQLFVSYHFLKDIIW